MKFFTCLFFQLCVSALALKDGESNKAIPPAVVNTMLTTLIGRAPFNSEGGQYQRVTQSPFINMHISKADMDSNRQNMNPRSYRDMASEKISEYEHEIQEINKKRDEIIGDTDKIYKMQGLLLRKVKDPHATGDMGIGTKTDEIAAKLEERATESGYKPVSRRFEIKELLRRPVYLTRYGPTYKTIEADPTHFSFNRKRYTPSQLLRMSDVKGDLMREKEEMMKPIMPERGDLSTPEEQKGLNESEKVA